MGREVRKVPRGWEHPKDWFGNYKALMDGYADAFAKFSADVEKYGLEEAVNDWGGGPVREDYMPEWTPDEATYYMMYENVTEGTPISPAFATPEELARWLADNGASASGSRTASYEAWLNVCRGGYAPSGAYSPHIGFVSGVEAMELLKKKE